jgi:site-specific DNA-methyltransferase (adenine-specific)
MYTHTNDRQDYKNYLKNLKDVFTECYRVLIKGGRMAVNAPSCITHHSKSRVAFLSIDIILMLRDVGFQDREIITWGKAGGAVSGKSTAWGSWRSPSNPALRDASEFIIIVDKETHKLEGDKSKIDITAKEFLKFSTNLQMFPPETNRIHPAPFPVALPNRIIKLYSYTDNIVLDPFCGSGTTCYVAKLLHRHYIGIDISPVYVRLAQERVGTGVLF